MTTNTHVVRAACPHDCPDTCALHVTVENGVAIKVQGDPEHPTTNGVLCTKVSRYTERTYHPDRLLHPLKRVGPKGSGQFVQVGWDEALDGIAARLRAIAAREPEAILPYSYAGTMGFVQGESMAARFFNKLGASDLDRTICASAGAAGLRYTYGAGVGMHVEHFADSKLILIWGSNPITSSVHFWAIAQEAKRRGAKLIAIDPYRSLTAEKCHQHIALLPGTDAALALGMMHVLIAENLVDHEYISRHTVGYAQLKDRVRRYTPARVAEICGIDEATIITLAREYASAKPAAIRLNYGMQRAKGGGQATRAVACLPALIGAWRDPAGGLLMSTSGYAPVDAGAQARPDLRPRRDKPARVVNMSAIGDALCHPGGGTFGPKIEALVVYNSNPVAVAPESGKVAAGFAREDLFTVVLEHFQTDTADYADFVLPATTQLEHLDIHKAYGHTYLLANNPAIAPLGEAKPNSEIFRLLARRMGWQEACFSDTDDQLAAQSMRWSDARMAGSDWETLKRDGWIRYDLPEAPFANGGFYTPSGKCEFYSERMLEEGFDPLPDWVPPYESVASNPGLAARYPLAMISPPARNFLNSSFVNVESLRASVGEPTLDIHPSDAASRGIADGAGVRIFNDRGTLRAKARVTEKAREGVVVGLSIWWKKLAPDGKNANEVTSQQLTDLGRAPTFYDCLVEVVPA
ncbi:molybdopterin oxidoreductase [Pandoraea pnomenusa]|uniref:Dimethyl sulfoxide reductase DmsA n=1 Tax=Pandoraea pnomenusa TaxID=93220 RepID=A0A378YLD7_9BURK|nr:molybdopterin oxidoreductase family protein [Pandoraea pnomenusa]AHB04218.1 molybdopterin oxidoreductase [Pandoraea pnomenusa 3kgm]AIU27080.1 molybdopterin oxidoreductase [Pandoraea pnomenusa]QDH61506.1 molybdopterin oxidoreductase family protein [Pandoraea pnomenusa]SUA77992.1 Dimethyl sulfoxide reductase DmsA precursor [Pandoraea pnomenusa]